VLIGTKRASVARPAVLDAGGVGGREVSRAKIGSRGARPDVEPSSREKLEREVSSPMHLKRREATGVHHGDVEQLTVRWRVGQLHFAYWCASCDCGWQSKHRSEPKARHALNRHLLHVVMGGGT
jgi:hypothetical protein